MPGQPSGDGGGDGEGGNPDGDELLPRTPQPSPAGSGPRQAPRWQTTPFFGFGLFVCLFVFFFSFSLRGRDGHPRSGRCCRNGVSAMRVESEAQRRSGPPVPVPAPNTRPEESTGSGTP